MAQNQWAKTNYGKARRGFYNIVSHFKQAGHFLLCDHISYL